MHMKSPGKATEREKKVESRALRKERKAASKGDYDMFQMVGETQTTKEGSV